MGDEKSRGTRTTGQTKNTMQKQGGCCTVLAIRSLFILTVVFPTSGRVKRTNRHHRHFDTNLRHHSNLSYNTSTHQQKLCSMCCP